VSYTPLNLDVYTAAFSGAHAGISASGRQPAEILPSDYVGSADVAGAFAQAIDQAWAGASSNALDIEVIEEASEGVWSGRNISNKAPFTLPSTWTTLAEAIVAMVEAGETYFASQGIVPPPWNSGGGGGGNLSEFVVPFTHATGTIVLRAVGAGQVLTQATIRIDTPFIDPIANVRLGTTTTPTLIFGPGDTDPDAAGEYQNLAAFEFAAADFLQLTIVPGTSPVGSGVLIYNYKP
jgi:hypothetical protein